MEQNKKIMEDNKKSFKILVVSDIHDEIDKIKILVEKYKDIKFDYVFCCGDVIDVPIGKNDVKEVTDQYVVKLKDISWIREISTYFMGSRKSWTRFLF